MESRSISKAFWYPTFVAKSFVLFLRYEKMISGMYMGEIVRLVLQKLCKHGLIFGGRGSEELHTMGRFYTKYVSEIER